MTTDEARAMLDHEMLLSKTQIMRCVSCLVDQIDTDAAALQAERDKHAAEIAAKDAEIERLKKDNSGLHEVIADCESLHAAKCAATKWAKEKRS